MADTTSANCLASASDIPTNLFRKSSPKVSYQNRMLDGRFMESLKNVASNDRESTFAKPSALSYLAAPIAFSVFLMAVSMSLCSTLAYGILTEASLEASE